MKNTKIDWADSTWNPVTGCENRCPYCYARSIATRFGGYGFSGPADADVYEYFQFQRRVVLDRPLLKADGHIAPYPFGFKATMHNYRLKEVQLWEKPRTIFVCSMADLFGEWIPDEWIEDVFTACAAAPQHRYMFLTKNPERYLQLAAKGILPEHAANMWFGSTVTRPDEPFFYSKAHNTFVSVEPIQEPFHDLGDEGTSVNLIIIGAETGNRSGRPIPKKEWIMELADKAAAQGVPVFMKESLRTIMSEDFRQELPWEAKTDEQ